MIKSLKIASPGRFLFFILIFLIITDLAIVLNIPVLRQVLGFLFLTFILGILILLILELNKLSSAEKIVLSVGLSVASIMLLGLALNALLLAIGYDKPLSTIWLLTSFNFVTIALAIIAYKKNKEINSSPPTLKLSRREKALLTMPVLFPLLSLAGVHLINLTDNNILLMLLLFVIPAFVIFISLYHNKVPQRLYPSLIFLIGISLLFMLSLRSNHIIGSDIHEAFYSFQTTLDNLYWRVTTPTLVNALLSVSVLPSVYYFFLNIDQEYLFKVLYPLLFSVSPVVVYIIARKYIGSFYAFIASFFFMAQVRFLYAAGGPPTTTATLFFALAIMALFHDEINLFARKLLLIIFIASCLVSHYGTSYIFFFLLLFTWIGMRIIPRILPLERKAEIPPQHSPTLSNPSLKRNTLKNRANNIFHRPEGITVTIVALFFTLLFFWYSQVTVAPFNVGVGLIYKTFTNLHLWFLLEAKGSTISAALGEEVYTIPQRIRVVFSWLTIAFVGIGILTTVVKHKGMVLGLRGAKPDFLHTKFDLEYFAISLASVLILVSAVILPYISIGYSMERLYFQALVVLAPFFAIGGIQFARWLRTRYLGIILAVLIPFFMCTTGTMYQIFGVPVSIVLNSAGSEYEYLYVHDTESYTAKWLKEYGEERIVIYTERDLGVRIFMSQGKIERSRLKGSPISRYKESKAVNGYIYLRNSADSLSGVTENYPEIIANKNKIYAADGSEIYR